AGSTTSRALPRPYLRNHTSRRTGCNTVTPRKTFMLARLAAAASFGLSAAFRPFPVARPIRRSGGLVRGEEPPDLRQQGGGYRNDGLVVGIRSRRLVRHDPLLVGPCVQLGKEFLDAFLIPAFGKPLLVHRPRLLRRRRKALSCLPTRG